MLVAMPRCTSSKRRGDQYLVHHVVNAVADRDQLAFREAARIFDMRAMRLAVRFRIHRDNGAQVHHKIKGTKNTGSPSSTVNS